MNIEKYNPRVVSIFEIFGCFFLNDLYINQYKRAEEQTRASDNDNITDRYRDNLVIYAIAIQDYPAKYKGKVSDLHEYCKKHSGIFSHLLSEFEDLILTQFVPAEFFKDYTNKQKDTMFNSIIIKFVNHVITTITSKEYYSRCIDERNDVLAKMLRNKCTEFLILIREEIHTRYVPSKAREHLVPAKLMNKLQSEYVAEVSKRVELEKINTNLQARLDKALLYIANIAKPSQIQSSRALPKTRDKSPVVHKQARAEQQPARVELPPKSRVPPTRVELPPTRVELPPARVELPPKSRTPPPREQSSSSEESESEQSEHDYSAHSDDEDVKNDDDHQNDDNDAFFKDNIDDE